MFNIESEMYFTIFYNGSKFCGCIFRWNNTKIFFFILKFTDYVFSDKYNDGKKELFETLGYTIKDSSYLQQLFITQALQKYCNGEYIFKGTNNYSVRLEIIIDINTPQKGLLHIKTGWVLLPNGEIKLSTPFTGFFN